MSATAPLRSETATSQTSDNLKLAPHISPTPLGLDLSAEPSVPVAAAPGEADLQTVALVEEGAARRTNLHDKAPLSSVAACPVLQREVREGFLEEGGSKLIMEGAHNG